MKYIKIDVDRLAVLEMVVNNKRRPGRIAEIRQAMEDVLNSIPKRPWWRFWK